MGYFEENSTRLLIREGQAPNTGLGRGQVGALYALAAHFIERHGHSPFLVGNRDETLRMIRAYDPISVIFTVYAVQPGLSAGGLAQNLRSVMAAANDSLTSQGIDLRWLISA